MGSSEELECLEFEKFEDYEDFDDYMRDYIRTRGSHEDEEGCVMMEDLYYRLYCVSLKEDDKDIRSLVDVKDLLNDISDACLIKINPLLLILEAGHYSYYDTMVDYQVSCQFKSFLENFDHPGDELDDDDDDDDLCGNTIRLTVEDLNDEYHRNLATKALEIYNQHNKAAKLKVVRLVSCTFKFDFAYKWFMTIYAVDEETGVMGTYQAALAKRGKACTLGLLRDVDANKILAILSIQGATRDMEAKMKFQAQKDAERKLWNLESLNKLNLANEDTQLHQVSAYEIGTGKREPSVPSLARSWKS